MMIPKGPSGVRAEWLTDTGYVRQNDLENRNGRTVGGIGGGTRGGGEL